MRELKYIIVRNRVGNQRAILFNGEITHGTIGKAMAEKEGYIIISAGFCVIDHVSSPAGIRVYGKSESLKLYPNANDRLTIFMTLARTHLL